MLKLFLVYLFQPNVSFWNALFSKRNIYQNQLINFPFFLLDRTFHVTLRGDMQLYHLMAGPGAFLSFWCFFFALCLSLIITFVILSILLSFIYAYKSVFMLSSAVAGPRTLYAKFTFEYCLKLWFQIFLQFERTFLVHHVRQK